MHKSLIDVLSFDMDAVSSAVTVFNTAQNSGSRRTNRLVNMIQKKINGLHHEAG